MVFGEQSQEAATTCEEGGDRRDGGREGGRKGRSPTDTPSPRTHILLLLQIYSARQKNVVKGFNHATFDHVFLANRVKGSPAVSELELMSLRNELFWEAERFFPGVPVVI